MDFGDSLTVRRVLVYRYSVQISETFAVVAFGAPRFVGCLLATTKLTIRLILLEMEHESFHFFVTVCASTTVTVAEGGGQRSSGGEICD